MQTFYTDAGTKDNGNRQGNQASTIAVFKLEDGKPKLVIVEEIGDHTVNEAEIYAIHRAIMLSNPEEDLQIYSDSQLAVYLITGKWKCHKPELKRFLMHLHYDMRPNITINWIPREDNYAGHYLESAYDI